MVLRSVTLLLILQGAAVRGFDDTVTEWAPGHQVLVKAVPGRPGKMGHIVSLNPQPADADVTSPTFKVLLATDAMLDEVTCQQMSGKPSPVQTCFTQHDNKKGNSTHGQRTGDVDEQHQQVAFLIECATTNLSSIINTKSNCKVLSLESVVEKAQASSALTSDDIAAKVTSSAQMMSVEDAPSPYPSVTCFLSLMFELGRATAKLDSEERQFAAGFIAVCLEYLLVGGEVNQRTILESFEANVRRQGALAGLKSSTSCKRLIASAGAEDGWHEKLLLPVRTLLTQLSMSGVLEGASPG